MTAASIARGFWNGGLGRSVAAVRVEEREPGGDDGAALGRRHRFLAYEPALDGLRGVAIAGVLAFHAFAASGIDAVRGGFLGVSLFFTLSGFLITSLLLRERDVTGGNDWQRFWARRIRRLAPAALVVVAVVIVASGPFAVLHARTADAVAATWSVTNWHIIAAGEARILQTVVGPLGPTWSLAVEEQFYVGLVVLVVLAMRTGAPRRVLAAVCALGWVVPVALTNLVSGWHPSLEFGTWARAPELFAGVALALWVTGARPPRLGPAQGDAVAGLGLAVLVLLMLFVSYDPPWLLRGGYGPVGIVSAVTLLGAMSRGRVAVALSNRPLVALGAVSYSLYLVHWPVILIVDEDRTALHGWALAAVRIVVALAVAAVLHVAVERPIRRLQVPWRPTFATWLAAGGILTVAAILML
ncbi:MAG: acyltransferase [Ilumatobacteraceae bacterium]